MTKVLVIQEDHGTHDTIFAVFEVSSKEHEILWELCGSTIDHTASKEDKENYKIFQERIYKNKVEPPFETSNVSVIHLYME